MPRVFDGVAGNHPRLNRFDLSYTNTTSMAFGLLYPVQCDECLPGDVWKVSAYCHTEVMPMVTPVMSDIQMFAHTFFVPYRILYGVDTEDGKSIWEKWITGGEDGDYDTPLPAWTPSFSKSGFSSRTIWDQIGNPVHRVNTGTEEAPVWKWQPLVPPSRVSGDLVHGSVYQGLDVCVAPRLAYNSIYNNFYRDENLVEEVADTNEDLLHVAFRKDYFTSALEAQQRGTAPALPVDVNFVHPAVGGTLGFLDLLNIPVSGTAPVMQGEAGSSYLAGQYVTTPTAPAATTQTLIVPPSDGSQALYSPMGVSGSGFSATITNNRVYANGTVNPTSYLNSAVKATTFTVSDLRLAFAIQRMQELNMRAGYRYTEWLSAHFGAHPTDARLDRPEYIGGAVINVSVSPLVQQSGTQSESGTQLTPQGTKTGIGHVDTVQKIGNYRVLEHGLIMTLVSIRPKPIYSQGINRQWLRQSRWDVYSPETAFLSEMALYNAELYVNGQSGEGEDDDIFGYQAHWNEMRAKNNMVTGAVRDQFSYWTLARHFASRPHLNQDFIEIDEQDFNQIFAVQDEDPFVVSWSNLIDCYRPIPAQGVPGLIDHVYGGF